MAEPHRKDRSGHQAYMRERAIQQRLEFAEWMAGQKTACVRCGFDDHRALVFHHRDPSTKCFQVAMPAWGRRREQVIAEIAKCDVLCANCHQIIHYKRSTGQTLNPILELGG